MYNHILRGLILDSFKRQEEFAHLIGISGPTLSKIIRGQNKKAAHRQLIADYFNKPVKDIFKEKRKTTLEKKMRSWIEVGEIVPGCQCKVDEASFHNKPVKTIFGGKSCQRKARV